MQWWKSRKSTDVSGIRVEETVVICITRDASFSCEPPEPSSIVWEEARGWNRRVSFSLATAFSPASFFLWFWKTSVGTPTKQGIVMTEWRLKHSAVIVKVLRLNTRNNTVSWGKFYLDCINRALGKKHSGLMLGPVLWIKWSKKLKRH